MSYFLEPHTHSKNKGEVELDLYNYATKSDLILIWLGFLGVCFAVRSRSKITPLPV